MAREMTKLLWIAPLVLFCACEEVLELPSSAKAERDSDPKATDRITVELTRHGVIRLDGKAVNLNQLGEALKHKAAVHHGIKKAVGESGWEDIPGGGKASKLFLMIRADKQAPWQHVQWLLTEAAMNKYYKIYFVATRADGKPGRVNAFLPTDKGVVRRAANAEVLTEVMVSVHLVARKERAQKWGDLEINMPTAFRYKFGDRETADLQAVSKWFGEAKEAAKGVKNGSVTSEIKAGHKVPFGKIVDLIAVYHLAGQKKIQFFGTQITHGSLRKKMRLPYTHSNYGRTK